MSRVSFTQPLCEACYQRREPGRVPLRVGEVLRETVRCCLCGRETWSGIWYRINPAEVPYPHSEEE